jgi:hypothetical protein
MNRFRVAKGSEADFEQVWLSRDSHLDKVPGFVEFHLLKGPTLRIIRFMLLTRCGKTVQCLKLGPSRRRFGQRTVEQGTISRCIWITRSSRALKFGRRWDVERARWRNRKQCAVPARVICLSAKQEANPDARRQPYRHNKCHQNRFH